MIDNTIAKKIHTVQQCVATINEIMAELHPKNVEIRLVYHEVKNGQPAVLELYRATEHVNYIQKC